MLQISHITHGYGEQLLLEDISWSIRPEERVALIGPNGAGKTTLLKILNGDIEPLSGTLYKPRDYRISCLPQEEVIADSGSVMSNVLAGRRDLLDLEARIERIRTEVGLDDVNREALLERLGGLEQEYADSGGFRLRSRAGAILDGLGIEKSEFDRPLSDLSGGWRMRALLARLLLSGPDLLLLDEPTNHLDLSALEWLEDFLLTFKGSVVLVSHDRYFIDRLAHSIVELERGSLSFYPGNYHEYERRKESWRELDLKKRSEQHAERQRQQRFIERFRYKATKAAQVQSRIKKLEKMETLPAVAQSGTLDFRLGVSHPSYKQVLSIKELDFSYPDDKSWALRGLNLEIYRGDRIALVGANGAGKTTLTRLITGELEPARGQLILGKKVRLGIYSQHQVEALDLEATVYDQVCSSVSDDLLPRVRDILGLFKFSGDRIMTKIGLLSGGEKARVSLAMLLLSPVNFLIMDEPTTHLDRATRGTLERALSGYEGTLLLISHDRYFLDKLVSRIVELRDGRLTCYEGDYSRYLDSRRQTGNGISRSPKPAHRDSLRELKRRQAGLRQAVSAERHRLRNEIEGLEREIGELESRQSRIESDLGRPETYRDGERAAQLSADYKEVKERISSCYGEWERAQTELEKLMQRLEQQLNDTEK